MMNLALYRYFLLKFPNKPPYFPELPLYLQAITKTLDAP